MTFDLAAAARAIGAPITVERALSAGSSSVTLLVRVGDVDAVLQRPPDGPVLPTAHDLARQHRFLTGLAHTAVLVPEVLAFVADAAAAGAPFLVTRRVAGVCLLTDPPPQPFDAGAVARAAIDQLAALHAVDPSGRGLPEPKGSYVDRQIARWGDQLARTPTARRLGDLAPFVAWLTERRPRHEATTIVHGDYGFHNLLVQSDRVTAVIDWELATLGDPLADLLGFVKSYGADPLSPNAANDAVAFAPGAPTRDELIARYEATTGFALGPHRAFYEAFALFKSLGVYEGVHARSGGTRFVTEPLDMAARLRKITGVR